MPKTILKSISQQNSPLTKNWLIYVIVASIIIAKGIIEAICRQHIAFERIHPFSDGNGRVGRALMVYICLQKGIAPIVVTKEDKAEYISYLNTEDVNGLTKFSLKLNADEEARINLFSQN